MPDTGRPLSRPRRALDQDRIVAAALALVDEDGIEHLSMRRLARRLDTAPMSLYRHVAGKDALLALVVEALTGQLGPADPDGPWDAVVADVFRRVRRLLAAHPGVAVHLADETMVTPATVEVSEVALEALRRAGLGTVEAAHAFTSLWTFTVGSALVEHMVFTAAPGPGGAEDRRSRVSGRVAEVAAGRYPRLVEFAPHWSRIDGDAAFEAGLGLLLDAVRLRTAVPDG